MLAGPIGAMVLPLTDDAPKVTKEILGHALELTIHHPTIGPKICNKWITVDTVIDAIRAAAVIDTSMVMNARLLNILLSKIQKYQLIDRFDGSNLSGFFRAKYSKQSYYIILPPGEQAAYPLFDKQWKEEVERVKSLISFRSLKSNDIPPVEHLLEQEKKGSSVQRQATYCVNPQNTKSDIHERQQDSDHVSMPKNTKSDSHERQQDSDHVDMPRQQSVCGTYWDSPEAYKLFRPRQCDSNCLSAVERRIKLLQRAQQFEGWRDLVHGRDPDNVCSNYDKLVIRQKSMFILKAYQIATLEMNRKTWLERCEIAVHEINLLGVTLTTRGDILSRWHRLFRTREAFLHPNLEARVGRDPLPPFLRMFPDAATKIKQFCRVNLLNLNVETVHQFILNKVFPRIYAVWASEQTSRGHTLQSFLKLFRISVFSPQTTLSWMKQLVGSNGERPLLPKSEGDGVMLSAFQSLLTGFGREMSTDKLQKVNEQRLNKTYWDGEAALEVLKSTSKPPLTASPFVRKLLIGINKEGYWNSNHMAVQFEDVVDCLKVLYPSHEFVFLFDHSQGHSRKRKGALDVNNMNVSFGAHELVQ
ncbi:hypothetical protein IV203_009959 [Nitzschia inconspicua]|uniref:Uncharacterized protein n=1 Tax=Nitzschia inconspicua TaxID=303405 RepID=A0A9K3KV85_9STRA|nr:hypothetical protein IV203_009959 [Nitzschia inconspicua]